MGEILKKCKETRLLTGSYIYFLMRDDDVVYIGKSNSPFGRWQQHSLDKHFTSIKYLEVSSEDQSLLENALITSYRPTYNSVFAKKLSAQGMRILNKYGSGELIEQSRRLLLSSQVKKKTVAPEFRYYGPAVYIADNEIMDVGVYDDDDECDHVYCKYSAFVDDEDNMTDELYDNIIEYSDCDHYRGAVFHSFLSAKPIRVVDRNDLRIVSDKKTIKKIKEAFPEVKLPWPEAAEAWDELIMKMAQQRGLEGCFNG